MLKLFTINIDRCYVAGSGTVTTTAASGTVTLSAGNNNTSTSFTGVIQNGTNATVALTKVGSGTLTLSGANSYTGATNISAGALKLGAADVIPDSSAVVVTGTLDINGNNETIGSIAGAGTVTSGVTGSKTLTVGGNGSSTEFSGTIQNGTATSISLTKTGAGTLTLSGSLTYSGATTINGGTIVIQNNAPSFSTSGFSGTGSLVIQPTLTSFASAYSFNKSITGLNALTIGASGNTADVTIAAAQSIAGPITIYGGKITLSANITDNQSSANAGIQLFVTGNIFFDTSAAGVTLTTTTASPILLAAGVTGSGGVIYSTSTNAVTLNTSGGNVTLGDIECW